MNKSLVGMKGKHRASNGKLKTSARTKGKKKSQGFSSSFTQKTMHNNTLLAQSLAKEKSRNEKMLSTQRDLIASRNEALMRLNEIETSFERMGMVVKKGIQQLQDIATTMGELYSEIQLFRNNPRDSASMRSSWQERNCMKRASTNISRMQTVKPMVDGHMITTQPRISLPRIDGRQEITAVNEPSPYRCPLLSTPLPVPAIDEESEVSNSDADNDDDEVRNNSLVCRAPRQPPRLETMQEFYNRVYAQDPQEGPSRPAKRAPPRFVRKVPRGVTKLPRRNFEMDSSSDECSVANRTTLCLVDMDETVIADSPIAETVSAAEVKEKTASLKMVKVEISPNLSYEKVFNISPSAECQTVSETSTTTTARHNLETLGKAPPQNNNDCDNGTQHPAAPDSPDFLGFPVEDNFPIVTKSLEIRMSASRTKSFSCVSAVKLKSATSNSKSTSSSLAHLDSESSQAASPNAKLANVPKHSEVCSDTIAPRSNGSRTPKSTSRRSVNNIHQMPISTSVKRSSKLKNTKCYPTTKNKSNSSVSPTMKNPTVLLSDFNLSNSKCLLVDGPLTSDTEKPSANKVLHEKPTLDLDETPVLSNNRPFQTKTVTLHLDGSNKKSLSFSTDICHRKSGKQTYCINTPLNPPTGEVPLETKSASECQKVLLIELERLPTVSKSAEVQPVTKKHKVSRTCRNTHMEGNENTNHVQTSSQRGSKRNSPFPRDLCDTPTRRSKTKSPNAVVLVSKLDGDTSSSDVLEESLGATSRRALRRIPPMNYKERTVKTKLRRPY